MTVEHNKYGVPHKRYTIYLYNGRKLTVDIGDESDWGNIQQMHPEDFDVPGFRYSNDRIYPPYFDEIPGWGNDSDGHVEIVAVYDLTAKQFFSVREWAQYVWHFADDYAS